MKKLKILSVLLLIASASAFVVFKVYMKVIVDNVPPVVTCESEEIVVPIDTAEEALMDGVKAIDQRSGDVSDTIVIEKMSDFTEEGKRIVTYAAVDDSKNVGRCERTIIYEGYESARFGLSGPLTFPVGRNVNVLTVLTATSVLDGDISANIKFTVENVINLMEPGNYPIEFRVMDSGGKTVYLSTEVEIYDTEYSAITVTLDKYLVYLKKGSKFNAKDYYKGASVDDVSLDINSNVNMKEEGTYYVDYVVSSGAAKGKSRLVVVVE